MLLLRDGQTSAALQSFERELADLREHQIYTAEFRVNAEVSAGFAHLAAGGHERCRRRLPPRARDASWQWPRTDWPVWNLLSTGTRRRSAADHHRDCAHHQELIAGQRLGEAALIKAAAQSARGDGDGACATLAALLDAAPRGHAGWLIPIDPAFAGLRTQPRYPQVMSQLAERAT